MDAANRSSAAKSQEKWDAGPCYICGARVKPSEGWHREDFDGSRLHWCQLHRPVWSWGERECIQHHYDYSAICPICGEWWLQQERNLHDRRTLRLLAAPLIQQDRDA